MELAMVPQQASASILGAALSGAAIFGGIPDQAMSSSVTMPALRVENFGYHSIRHVVSPEWAERQFMELAKLNGQWDQFDIDPIQSKTVSQLRALLAAARNSGEHSGHIIPGADGSLQAEWHLDDAIVGALVEDDGDFSSWVRFVDDGAQSEAFGLNAIDFLRSLAVTFRLNV